MSLGSLTPERERVAYEVDADSPGSVAFIKVNRHCFCNLPLQVPEILLLVVMPPAPIRVIPIRHERS
jgi:hypothetical protein